jgi:hypothetical protein
LCCVAYPAGFLSKNTLATGTADFDSFVNGHGNPFPVKDHPVGRRLRNRPQASLNLKQKDRSKAVLEVKAGCLLLQRGALVGSSPVTDIACRYEPEPMLPASGPELTCSQSPLISVFEVIADQL